MRKEKKVLTLVLALVLMVGSCAIPALATPGIVPEKQPTVFVHGLLGWGSYDGINSRLPYWGMMAGSIVDYLNSEDYDCYSASVGPLSSAWDRSCELYAQLTGTRTDYGAKHSKDHGHERYGQDFTGKALFGKPWDYTKDGPINLVGHSFGGATIRMFAELMANGSEDERNYPQEDLSPLFASKSEEDLSDKIISLTTVAAPHNGTTFIETNSGFTDVAKNLFTELGKILEAGGMKEMYDFQLEHFGIGSLENETVLETWARIMESDFLTHRDNAFMDLEIDQAMRINDEIEMQPGLYYFSYAGDCTYEDSRGNHLPLPKMMPLIRPFSIELGKYCGETTNGGYYIDETWLPNDAMVNTVSAMYPIKSNGEADSHKNLDPAVNKDPLPGTWNVMPIKKLDHGAIIGGSLNVISNGVEVRALYDEIMQNIVSIKRDAPCTRSRAAQMIYLSEKEPEAVGIIPFIDVLCGDDCFDAVRWAVGRNIIKGTSPTTFSPDNTCTRGQIATMLYREAGRPRINGWAPFVDVRPWEYYYSAVSWAVQNGITKGTSFNTFSPDLPCTRLQIETFISRAAK